MKSHPNILWIVTTQWRAQACGYAGDPNARTPQLDALAAESVNYPEAVTPHPFGPMARAALLTGVASPQNGVRDYFDALPAGARTIAHELRERGYATAFFGKWGVGRRDPTVPVVGEAAAKVVVPAGERGGFELWEGFEGGFLLNDPWLHGSRLGEPRKFPGYQSDLVGGRAAAWLREQGAFVTAGAPADACEHRAAAGTRRPWFAVVSWEAPHPPYDAPAAGVTARQPGEISLAGNVPRGGEVETRARRELAGYYAQIEATDRAIGRLLADVRREDTVVVFTSVHGDMHGAHGLFRKGWPHEESVRVPLLIRGLGRGDAGRTDHAAISLVDLPALMVAAAENRAPTIERAGARISMPSVVALPHQCDRPWRGVRTRTRKLVLDERGEPWCFFELDQDPLEMKNLAGDPARQEEMAALRALAGLG